MLLTKYAFTHSRVIDWRFGSMSRQNDGSASSLSMNQQLARVRARSPTSLKQVAAMLFDASMSIDEVRIPDLASAIARAARLLPAFSLPKQLDTRDSPLFMHSICNRYGKYFSELIGEYAQCILDATRWKSMSAQQMRAQVLLACHLHIKDIILNDVRMNDRIWSDI